MKKIVLILGIVVLILIGSVFVFNKIKANEESDTQVPSMENVDEFLAKTSTSSSNKYETRTETQTKVTVDVTPKQLGVDQGKNIFEVDLNTHSVELDFDFTEIMILEDDLGNTYKALEWTGNRGWHHVSGDIVFPKINQQATSIKLKIASVGGVDRIFKWNIR